jgi:hypothetical protein
LARKPAELSSHVLYAISLIVKANHDTNPRIHVAMAYQDFLIKPFEQHHDAIKRQC